MIDSLEHWIAGHPKVAAALVALAAALFEAVFGVAQAIGVPPA